MTEITNSHFLEPIIFAGEADFLSGNQPDLLPSKIELEADLNRAMELENTQDPPPGYHIWKDSIDASVSPFYSTANAREGEAKLESAAEEVWAKLAPREMDLKKKQLKSGLSEKEEFWLVVAYDSFELLKLVAIGRYVTDGEGIPFLEDIFQVYRAGFYPCGLLRDGSLVAFDVRALEG